MTVSTMDRAAQFNLRVPSRASGILELRALLEASSLLPSAPLLMTQPRGDHRQVLLLPGFMADDRSTWPLRRYLDWLGYDSMPWELGRNKGRPEHDAEQVVARLKDAQRTGEPITLIGWSLGGVIARLVARAAPQAVREVITLGSPVEGGPKYTAAGNVFARSQGMNLDEFEQRVHRINSEGLKTPLTVIYSRSDAIVDWRAAIDRYNEHAKHVRVPGSHLGLGTNPLVWATIARTLRSSR